MNISKTQIDDLNAVITINVEKADYNTQVEETIANYRKTANVPGFRKGHVPASMIKRQYGKAIKFDEINKVLQDALYKYLADEKLNILANPLPKEKQDINLDADDFSSK